MAWAQWNQLCGCEPLSCSLVPTVASPLLTVLPPFALEMTLYDQEKSPPPFCSSPDILPPLVLPSGPEPMYFPEDKLSIYLGTWRTVARHSGSR